MPKKTSSGSESRVTRDDVARLAGVSGATVSRVLNGGPSEPASPEIRARVLEAVRSLGYVPNSTARALRNGRTGLIGFWVCLGYSRYRGEVLARMRDVLGKSDYALAVTDVDEEYAWHHSFARPLRVPVEGVIAFDAATAGDAFAKDSDRVAPNLPYVSMGAYWSESKSYVGVDLRAGAEMATDHLVKMGWTRIVYLTVWGIDSTVEAGRREGYENRMAALGREFCTLEVSPRDTERVASIVEALTRRRREGSMPDAFLCMYDDIATDAMIALQEMGLKPGVDVGLVGINGSEGTDRGACPLTVVRQPVEKMCSLAFEFLKAQMDDSQAPLRQVVLTPELIVRRSSLRENPNYHP